MEDMQINKEKVLLSTGIVIVLMLIGLTLYAWSTLFKTQLSEETVEVAREQNKVTPPESTEYKPPKTPEEQRVRLQEMLAQSPPTTTPEEHREQLADMVEQDTDPQIRKTEQRERLHELLEQLKTQHY